jgi:hypothetical protein
MTEHFLSDGRSDVCLGYDFGSGNLLLIGEYLPILKSSQSQKAGFCLVPSSRGFGSSTDSVTSSPLRSPAWHIRRSPTDWLNTLTRIESDCLDIESIIS